MSNFNEIINFLSDRKIKLVTAESCTAGLVASSLAATPGCGAILEMGYVTYSVRAKHLCLGVNLQTIKSFGLTSEEVAVEMAVGALNCIDADLSIGVTGTAESNDLLSGKVCFAYALNTPNGIKTETHTLFFNGDREAVMKSAAEHAIINIPSIFDHLLNAPA